MKFIIDVKKEVTLNAICVSGIFNHLKSELQDENGDVQIYD